MLSKPSDECNSAGLNSTDVHLGHSCRIRSRCGSQSGRFQTAIFNLFSLRTHYKPVVLSESNRCHGLHRNPLRGSAGESCPRPADSLSGTWLLGQIEMSRHVTPFAKKHEEPLHNFAHLSTTGAGAPMKLRSLVKAGTPESRPASDNPGTSIGAALEALLERLTFEDLVAATVLACLTLSGCRALRAAK